MSEENANETTVFKTQIIAIAVIISPLIYITVCTLLHEFVIEPGQSLVGEEMEWLSNFYPLIILIALPFIPLSIWFRNRMVKRDPSLDGCLRAILVSMAITQAGSIIGMLYYFLTGELINAILVMGIGFIGSMLLFPTRSWLDRDDVPLWEQNE